MTGTAARHAAFVEAYISNGHNATAAATAIGCAGKQLLAAAAVSKAAPAISGSPREKVIAA